MEIPAGRLVRLGVVLDTRDLAERVALVARLCDLAGVDALWGRPELLAAAEPAARRIQLESGPPGPTSIQLAVSIGRTETEARARAAADPRFEEGAERRLVGTLEQCQTQVIELAHEGIEEIRCVLPNVPDIHDIIAQLTAMVAGSKAALAPGQAPSQAPAPPRWI